jgi:hypothetical protein
MLMDFPPMPCMCLCLVPGKRCAWDYERFPSTGIPPELELAKAGLVCILQVFSLRFFPSQVFSGTFSVLSRYFRKNNGYQRLKKNAAGFSRDSDCMNVLILKKLVHSPADLH